MAKKGKRFRNALEGIERGQAYPVEEAVKLIKECAGAKFDETIEIALNLAIDPRHADQNVRDAVVLPNGTGKTVRVAGSMCFLYPHPQVPAYRCFGSVGMKLGRKRIPPTTFC